MGARLLKLTQKFPVHPSFLLLFLWFIFAKDISSFFLFISATLSHEFGHYFVAKKLGYKLDKFFLAPYGACLNYKEKAFEYKDEIKIAIAGPAINLLLCLATVSIWWVWPSFYNFSYEFVLHSFSIALFNLLPCYPLDGGRVFVGIVSKNKPRKWGVKLSQIFNVVTSAVLIFLFVVSCFYNFNPTLCLCGCFLLFGVFESKNESKYQPAFIYKKKTKNFSKPFFICVNGSTTISESLKRIESNRFTIFVVILSNKNTKFIDENTLKKLLLKNSFNLTFDEMFSNKYKKNIESDK